MIARKTCTALPSQSLDGPDSNCKDDCGEYTRCDFCDGAIPEGEAIEFFPGEQWHARCRDEAKAIPGFLDAGEVFAIGYSR